MKAQRSVFKHGKAKKHKHTHTHTLDTVKELQNRLHCVV